MKPNQVFCYFSYKKNICIWWEKTYKQNPLLFIVLIRLSKHRLLLIAWSLRIIAWFFIMKIGIPLLWKSPLFRKLLLPALMIFLIFYKLIFSPLVKKHHQRIMRMSVAKMAWYNFFDRKSYLIMICMMTLGVLIRKLQLVPEWNIAFFYSGLGWALFSCGVRFIVCFLSERKKFLNPAPQ